MNSKAVFAHPLVVSAAVAGLLAFACGDALAQAKNSKALAKPLQAATDSFKAKKYQDAIAKLRVAEGTPGKTPYDQHLINEMMSYSCVRINDYACAGKTYEALLTDGFTTPAQIQSDVRALVNIDTLQLKSYDKAIEYGNRAIKEGFADEDTRVLVGQAYYLKGDFKGAVRLDEARIDSLLKAGQVPKLVLLNNTRSACARLDDKACETRQLERLVTYYPKPEYWQGLLVSLERQATGDANKMQAYRLMNDVGVLTQPDAYGEMGSIAMDQGAPAEAQHSLENGLARGVFANDAHALARAQRALESAKKKAAEDQANLPNAEKAADAATDGQAAATVGQAYFGYQQYDKAVAVLTKALTKGGLKNAADTRLLLGIAQLKAGHKDDAVKTFRQVKGDPTLERVANLWVIHARQA
jgi:tetratricopeptide (TPR) repeat protein